MLRTSESLVPIKFLVDCGFCKNYLFGLYNLIRTLCMRERRLLKVKHDGYF
jgi:hypothetical protein